MPRKNRNQRRNNKPKSVRKTDTPTRGRFDHYTVSTRLTRPTRIFHTVALDNANGLIQGNIANPAAGGITFKLSNIADYTSYTSLFDQYQITAIDFILRPRNNVTNSASIAVTLAPLLLVIDYDDATSPASASVLQQYQNVMVVESYQSVRRVFKPSYTNFAYQGATPGYSVNQGWCDCAYPDILHYGIKYYIGATGVSNYPDWDVCVYYHISFRNVR